MEGRKGFEPASVPGALFRYLDRSSLQISEYSGKGAMNAERFPWERKKEGSTCFAFQGFLIWAITMATSVLIISSQRRTNQRSIWGCFNDLNVFFCASKQVFSSHPLCNVCKYYQSDIWVWVLGMTVRMTKVETDIWLKLCSSECECDLCQRKLLKL